MKLQDQHTGYSWILLLVVFLGGGFVCLVLRETSEAFLI